MVEHKTKSLAQKEAKASELHPWRFDLEVCPSRLPYGHPYTQVGGGGGGGGGVDTDIKGTVNQLGGGGVDTDIKGTVNQLGGGGGGGHRHQGHCYTAGGGGGGRHRHQGHCYTAGGGDIKGIVTQLGGG